ncbi:hypothetical protein [Oceanirhabdus sp. W0125-5]|uniref:hypothetical protein n=1 Tax=Oceanirhabdus sp. W0125-5 TaxID=2999116 RepID=UPI0022F2A98E|nr:hypothetical protein [Oceanirhabdus sp. W0125-5]WBW94922.1 hypothetical protein OW730_14585 [Oceanirhabdus sp. W0125-5]
MKQEKFLDIPRSPHFSVSKWRESSPAEHLKSQGVEDFFPRENFLSEKVVRDKNIVTAVGNAFIDFSMEILDYFEAFEGADNNADKETFAKHYKGL